MKDHIREQVSQFMDDELSREECEFFVRRLLQHRDGETRNLYMRYQLIGAAIRGDHLSAPQADLRERLNDALTQSESRTASKGTFGFLMSGAGRAFVGAGIAAGVAAAALLLIRPGAQSPESPLLSGTPVAEARLERLEPPSYVVPLQVPATPVVRPEVRLTGLQYLMHHGGHASSLGRTVAHTNVLSVEEDEDIVATAAGFAAP